MPFTSAAGTIADGATAGINEFGQVAYVGRAAYGGQLAPAKLFVEASSDYAAALYFPYGGLELVLTTGYEYYAKESRCKSYTWVPSKNGEDVPNAVRIPSPPYTFLVGRFTPENGSVEIGKVTLQHLCMYYGSKGYERITYEYEVLVCNKK